MIRMSNIDLHKNNMIKIPGRKRKKEECTGRNCASFKAPLKSAIMQLWY